MSLTEESKERLSISIKNVKELCARNDVNISDIKYRLSILWNTLINYSESNDDAKIQNLNYDRRKADSRLGDFDPKNSKIWKKICNKFSPNLSQNELVSLAEIIASNVKIKVDREARRRKEVLIKWFDENSEKIDPFINIIHLSTD